MKTDEVGHRDSVFQIIFIFFFNILLLNIFSIFEYFFDIFDFIIDILIGNTDGFILLSAMPV